MVHNHVPPKGKQAENRPRVVGRSGKVVKVVDKDNLYGVVMAIVGLIQLLGHYPYIYLR